MIYYRPVRELLADSMKELRQFEYPFSFYSFLRDKYPNTLIRFKTCGEYPDERINWNYTMSISLYDPDHNRFDCVGWFYDDAFLNSLDFFQHRFTLYYSYNKIFYSVLGL